METLQNLFQNYITYAAKLREETASVKSVLGMRDREIYDAGHQSFDNAVENWVKDFAENNPAQEELWKALELLLFAAVGQEGKAAYWYLAAVQRHGSVLIPMLDEDNRGRLAAAFAEQYPVRQQLPMQKELYQLLMKNQKQKKRFSLFR